MKYKGISYMFTAEERGRLRSDLLEYAKHDQRIGGAAITGSAVVGQEDQWSDIDLAFGILDAHELPNVMTDLTKHMYSHHSAVQHLDVKSGSWIYRVFLMPNTLQIDIAFVPSAEFRPLAPTFCLVSGKANAAQEFSKPQPLEAIGLGWLYAVSARTSIARGRLWQAEYMISEVRDNAFALACIRHGLPTAYGKGMDKLPTEVAAQFEEALVRLLDRTELVRAFYVVLGRLLHEIKGVEPKIAESLEKPFAQLFQSIE
jgi:hypothetical protein